jgi:hypothetical protein
VFRPSIFFSDYVCYLDSGIELTLQIWDTGYQIFDIDNKCMKSNNKINNNTNNNDNNNNIRQINTSSDGIPNINIAYFYFAVEILIFAKSQRATLQVDIAPLISWQTLCSSKIFLLGIHGVVLVYDICDRTSFKRLVDLVCIRIITT